MNSRLHSSSTVFALMVIAIAMCFPVECQETRLQLMANNDECDQCIRSNGQCGSNSASPELFACFCATGNFSLTCNDSNESEGGSNGTVTKTESNETTVITGSNATMTIIGSNGTTTITRSNGTTTITRFNATTTETGFNGTTTETGSNGTTTETGSNGTTTKTGSSGTTRKLVIGISCVITGIMFLLFVILCRKLRLHLTQEGPKAAKDQIEMFIRNHGSLAPKRYKYSQLKKMTNSFLEKLGQGGYGSVYKGQLPDGHLVAVKLLSEARGDGEDFINEVASISRTSHVNIVTLLGFCFEGKKRALLYEFMPNGSLDKFLHCDGSQLDWATLFQIAKGIARGLEYLHRGCNTRIVHFDIKPHNILLDEEFVPKISDFGLAKLCKKKESIVSVNGARGTPGYMAPEVFLRNRGGGGASHKSDVYSYGMMLLEMTGAHGHNNTRGTSTSEGYFPDWIYKLVEVEGDLGDYGMKTKTKEEEELARKMMVVSLWCIQLDQSIRPSIGKIVEMLEGSFESLQVPPRHFESSPARFTQGVSQLDTLSSTS